MFLATGQSTKLAVHDLGGDGPTILICHATGFCGRAYEPLARVLASRFHVWALDFPGHGDSDPPANDDYAWTLMVGAVAAASKAIASTPLACVVGHSMGGAVALEAAVADPSLFAAAYVYEPAMLSSAPPVRAGKNPMAEGARRRQDVFSSKAAALWRYAARPPLNEFDAASLAAYVEHGFTTLPDGTVRLKCSPENEARTFESGAGITVGSVAGAGLPTLCVMGGDQGSPMPALVPPLAEALPNAALRLHPHLGHFGPLQSPALIGAEIARHATEPFS